MEKFYSGLTDFHVNADRHVNETNSRSSHLEEFCQESVLKNFAKFTGKHLCQSLFFNIAAG